jgi:hypothetical protein
MVSSSELKDAVKSLLLKLKERDEGLNTFKQDILRLVDQGEADLLQALRLESKNRMKNEEYRLVRNSILTVTPSEFSKFTRSVATQTLPFRFPEFTQNSSLEPDFPGQEDVLDTLWDVVTGEYSSKKIEYLSERLKRVEKELKLWRELFG